MIMDDSHPPSVPKGPPPPDLPKPSIPPPSLPRVPEPVSAPVPNEAPEIKEALKKEAEGDEPESDLAPFNTRVIAAVIDVLIAIGLLIALLIVLPPFMGGVTWAVGIGYLLTRDSLPFLGGQSVGKKAVHLRVQTLEGKSLTGNWQTGLIRNALLCLPGVGVFLELYILLSREGKPDQGRRLGDEWARTKVIVEPTYVPDLKDQG